jgi:Tol biopolymer transport system component
VLLLVAASSSFLAALSSGCAGPEAPAPGVVPGRGIEIIAGRPVPDVPGETCLRNVRQLTFGGQNAEAYWSGDGRRLILQSTRGAHRCDQIFVLDLTTGDIDLVSTGKGRTTCSYFLQGDDRILYASTHLADDGCPPAAMRSRGKYVWALYQGYDIFTAKPDGSDLRRITDTPGYDAEGTVCPVTGRIVFTSTRDGDLELYSMEPDGSDIERLTDRPGYDGGAFYSHDGRKIVQRSGFLETDEERKSYEDLLRRGLVEPSKIEITVIDRDGSNFRQVTRNGKANFAPFWHPDNRRILFASNLGSEDARDFDIYIIDEDGTNQKRVTHSPAFDAFPMFSPDGRYLVFASNRFNDAPGETNVFVAEWVEPPADD